MSLLLKDANGIAQRVGAACSGSAAWRYAVSQITPVSTPLDFAFVQGSATTTVKVRSIRLVGFAAAAGSMMVKVGRTAALGTANGSTSLTTVTGIKKDTNTAAATAAVKYVQGADYDTPATTTLVATGRLGFSLANQSAVTGMLDFDFTASGGQPIVLRGTSEYLMISLGGDAVPTTGKVDLVIELEEEA